MNALSYTSPAEDARQTSGALEFNWAETMEREELPVGDAIYARTDSIIDFGYGSNAATDYSTYQSARKEHNATMRALFGNLPIGPRKELEEWSTAAHGRYPVFPAYPMAIVSMAPQGRTGEVKGVVLYRGGDVSPVDCAVVWFDGVEVGQRQDGKRVVQRLFPLTMQPGQRDVEIPGADGNVEVRFTRSSKGEVLIERPGIKGHTLDEYGDERPSMRVRYNRRFTPVQQAARAIGWLAAFFA